MSLDKVIIISFILLFGVNKAFSQEVDKWRKNEAVKITKKLRPDLIKD